MESDGLEVESLPRSMPGEDDGPVLPLRPEILTHPNVPKPLHGVNPRTVLGQKWWDEKRREAYAKMEQRCWACGVHRTSARLHRLEAHEAYDIDYLAGRIFLREIVALCPDCHAFIHSGRMWALLEKGEVTRERFEAVQWHGRKLLREAGLSPWWGTEAVWIAYQTGIPKAEALAMARDHGLVPDHQRESVLWEDWRLVVDGQEYPPKFATEEEYEQHYGVQDE